MGLKFTLNDNYVAACSFPPLRISVWPVINLVYVGPTLDDSKRYSATDP